jgi:hypothetical protein
MDTATSPLRFRFGPPRAAAGFAIGLAGCLVLDGVYRSDAARVAEFIEAAAPPTRNFTRCCTTSSSGTR